MLKKNYEITPKKITIASDCHRYYPFIGLYWAIDLSFLVLGALGLGGVLGVPEKYRLVFGLAFLVAGFLIAMVALYVTLVLMGREKYQFVVVEPSGISIQGRRKKRFVPRENIMGVVVTHGGAYRKPFLVSNLEIIERAGDMVYAPDLAVPKENIPEVNQAVNSVLGIR
jgi:hypothetical protein